MWLIRTLAEMLPNSGFDWDVDPFYANPHDWNGAAIISSCWWDPTFRRVSDIVLQINCSQKHQKHCNVPTPSNLRILLRGPS